jgi:hypothetical protein
MLALTSKAISLARRLLYMVPVLVARRRDNDMANKASDNREKVAIKHPADWVTGDEPMTGAQESYLGTLAREAGTEVNDDLTKAEASETIEKLQEKTGRGTTARKGRRKTAK